jgi:predicted RNA-binding Zn ribbon-like protein
MQRETTLRPRDLPSELELPLASGEQWWYFVGGRPSVDLVNTLRERWRRRVETLVTEDDLSRWLVQAGVLDQPVPVDAALLTGARDLREAIDEAFQHVIRGKRPPRASIGSMNTWLPKATGVPELRQRGAELRLDEHPQGSVAEQALGLLALDAAQLLSEAATRERLRICASGSCSARFFDASPAGRRQWCSMLTCGNVAKARRFRERRAHAHGRVR